MRQVNSDNPFSFGALALDEAFADREAELGELTSDIRNGQDVVVFAPRRYGKSSLVWRATAALAAEGVLVAQVDLMTSPTKEALAAALARSIYEQIASTLERVRERALAPFRGLQVQPTVSVSPDDGLSPSPLPPLHGRPRSTRRWPGCWSFRPSSVPPGIIGSRSSSTSFRRW